MLSDASRGSAESLFPLGMLVATPGALDTLSPADIAWLIGRHVLGDWGDVCREDARANDRDLRDGGRLLSVYLVAGIKVYIITEYDRSVTTILLAEEY